MRTYNRLWEESHSVKVGLLRECTPHGHWEVACMQNVR